MQEESCGEAIFAGWGAPVCQLETEHDFGLEPCDTERKTMNCTRPGYICSFVCRMYRLQHEEGQYFLHEHQQSKLPWREDCVSEVQELTGANLMSVNCGAYGLSLVRSEGKLGLDKKPTTMMTNCPAVAFTLNRRCFGHLESSERCRAEHDIIEHLRVAIFRRIQLLMEQTARVFVGQCGREHVGTRDTVFLLKNQLMTCSIKHGMMLLELLGTLRRSRKPGSSRWSTVTRCTCTTRCLLPNAGKGQARRL